EHEARFLAEELRQLGLEPLVQIERAVQQSAAGAARAVALECVLGRGQDLGMMREPQIVVGAHHDPLFAFDHDDRVFRVGDRAEVPMSRSAVVFVWLFAAARPAASQTPYRVTWWDAASVGTAGALSLIPVALNLPHGQPPCAPCDPASVPGIDRAGLHNSSAS